MNFLLIGKPNTGKSSIYNILTSGKKNIIHKEEGTTRDWHKSNVINFNNIYVRHHMSANKTAGQGRVGF